MRIKAEQKEYRRLELERLQDEYVVLIDETRNRNYQLDAEEKREVSYTTMNEVLKIKIKFR